jgi:hypothetical protein
MPYSNYAANKIIDHANGRTSWTLPGCYLGLFTTLPTGPSNAGTEASGGSYARLAIGTGGASLYGAAASGVATNTSQINITAPAGTMVGAGMWDAITTGNLLAFWNLQQQALNESVTLSSGHGVLAHAPAENLTVKNSAESTTYTEGVDYYVNYDAGTLERISTGAITASQVLHITYNYPVTKTTTDGDTIIGAIGNYGFALKGYQA